MLLIFEVNFIKTIEFSNLYGLNVGNKEGLG